MSNIHADEYLDQEWWSQCCTAPPLWELDYTGDPTGICMSCRDNAVFEIIKEDEDD